MMPRFGPSLAIAAVLAGASFVQPAWAMGGQAFAEAVTSAAIEASNPTGLPDGMVFAEGTRAINDGRWADAVAIFTKIAERKSDHADGALYWKAYALNKLGQTDTALESCAGLRASYPKSSWIEECGALEIEMHAKSGKPVEPKPEQSDNLKLLALNSLMQHEPDKARAQIEDILNDEDAPDPLRSGALFLLGQQRSNVSYPEIARISYVEGDVRIARGRENEKNGSAWEKAEADTPLESGFSLVTGTGKAEIELEDASTLYLGENSVLVFNDLHTTDNIPYTEAALLAGTVTIHVKPYVAGEVFVLKTPTDDNLMATYPNLSYLRITSYLDATAITPLEGGMLHLKGASVQAVAGQTAFYRTQHRLEPGEVKAAESFADWDKWVAERVAARTASTSEAMEAAGLATPLPGLAELQGQGTFFACAPYGTCWEPAEAVAWEKENGEGSEAERPSSTEKEQFPQDSSGEPAGMNSPKAPSAAMRMMGSQPSKTPQTRAQRLADNDFFPCSPGAELYRLTTDATVSGSRYGASKYPYQWAVCHAGYWIRHNRHYAWVVGKRHHHPPYRWVKSGKTAAFVPIHPKDVKGELPVNGKERLFAVVPKSGGWEGPVKFDPNRPIALMKEPPREFRGNPMPLLAKADEPHAVAHSIKDAGASKELAANPGAVARPMGVPITFDHKSQSFMLARQEMRGGQSVTVNRPIGNQSGSLQWHAEGFAGTNGMHSGGFSGSSGTRAGGGSAGGASHTSGGGGTTGAGSHAAPSAPSAPSSSGGGAPHH